jgi:thiosulfate/3-mercaptopyruvate sulfurtransferase
MTLPATARGPLITAADLADRLGEFHVYDIRWSLADPDHGRDAFLRGHVPGAVFVDLDRDLAAAPSIDGRHPLPDPATFAATLGRLGLTPADPVVVYDDSGGSVAARMWWMLISIGHTEVLVLDGGFQAWLGSGRAVEIGDRIPEEATYPVPDGYTGVVGWNELEGRVLIDARAPERYRGEVEPVDPKAGHIPGAVNVPYTGNLDDSGRFLDPETLAKRFEGAGPKPVVYCGSGVNACHLALAMAVAGMEAPDLYAGSFSEWARRDLPVETSG